MENVMIKRLISVCIVVILTFCIYVCAQTAVDNSVAEPETVESENTDAADAEPEIVEAENTENDGENMAQENADKENADGDNAKIDIAVSTIESSVSVIMKTEVIPLIDENGNTYYTLSSTYPVISIEGNENAAEKINADIRSRIEPFLSSSESYEFYAEDVDFLHKFWPELTDTGYREDWTYEVTRADDNVISFAITNCYYNGGAHAHFNTIGVSYDTNTGEQISFDDLSEDTEHFRMATLAYNQALAETEAYSDLMYEKEYSYLAAGTLEDVLYRDDRWYLSAYGLVFLSNPYALGSFAAGLIEFTIPYSDLEDMGFNEAYTYTGRLIVKLLDGEIYSVDLNGDGVEETVAYSWEFVRSDETDTYEDQVHLIIDGFDFGQNGDDDTKELLADYLYSKLILYDLDINDDYVEVVLLTGWLEGRDNTYYSNFFRYTKDGSLVYLGRVKGNVTDFSVSASAFEN